MTLLPVIATFAFLPTFTLLLILESHNFAFWIAVLYTGTLLWWLSQELNQ